MRISDWSSDVCSSDLHDQQQQVTQKFEEGHIPCRRGMRHYGNQIVLRFFVDALLPQSFEIHRALDEFFTPRRSEEHTSELQSLMRISYAVFCLKKKKHTNKIQNAIDDSRITQYVTHPISN